MRMTEDVVVAVIAGGKSRRMGQDKAHLLVDGLPLLARTVFAAQTVAARVLIVGRSPEAGFSGVEFLDDAAPGLGPLGGIATALRHAKGAAAAVLALACDMPRLTPETLQWLLDAAAMEEAADGVAVVNGEQIEPLFSVYRPPCLPLLEQRISESRLSAVDFIKEGRFARCAAPPPVAAALANVNTPEEYAALTTRERLWI